MQKKVSERKAELALLEAFRKNKDGLTPADLAAKTGLPLETVKSGAASLADEYGAKLSVTESGEILYSFPNGFKSRYKGALVFFKKAFGAIGKIAAAVGKVAFKVWIMVMLVGYFALFMLLALAALVLSLAAQNNSSSSSSRSSSGAVGFAGSIFNMIIRLWFYSELFNMERSYREVRAPAKKRGRPLHQAIFSFVFGEENPNANIETRHKKALAAFVQQNKGLINLEEYIAITGKTPLEADADITAFCVEFSGTPEVTLDGTIVYKFDALLLKKDAPSESGAAMVPFKEPRVFSLNSKKMNGSFAFINAVNLLFGGYFLHTALTASEVTNYTLFFAITHNLIGALSGADPRSLIALVLGVVPIAFSVLFWLIPIVRSVLLKGENRKIKLENLRKIITKEVYEAPLNVEAASLNGAEGDKTLKESVLRELSFFGSPDVVMKEGGAVQYSFLDIERDRDAVKKARSLVKSDGAGKVIFET